MQFRYEDLEVGWLVLDLIDSVCFLTGKFPHEEKWILVSQIRRAINSVYLNLAEGSARRSFKDFARFIIIAKGSLIEAHAGLRLALRRGYITKEELGNIQPLIEKIWFKLCELHQSQINQIK